jgi:hypothetical protein
MGAFEAFTKASTIAEVSSPELRPENVMPDEEPMLYNLLPVRELKITQ